MAIGVLVLEGDGERGPRRGLSPPPAAMPGLAPTSEDEESRGKMRKLAAKRVP